MHLEMDQCLNRMATGDQDAKIPTDISGNKN
jgi:hypothetical protein